MKPQTAYLAALALGASFVGLYIAWRGWAHWQPRSIDDPAARRIISLADQAYATCVSYTDTGEVRYLGDTITFKTNYKAPGKLYFEFTDKDPGHAGHCIVWCEGKRQSMRFGGIDSPSFMKEVYVATWFRSFDKANDTKVALSMALGASAGISMGSSHTVPSLLLPNEIHGQRLNEMVDLRVVGTETVEGQECDELMSKTEGTTLFIDKKSHLLRKMVENSDGTIVTTNYHPSFGGNVDDQVFIRN